MYEEVNEQQCAVVLHEFLALISWMDLPVFDFWDGSLSVTGYAG